MYKGPLDMDNRMRIVLGSGGWAGQGRAMEENWDNYNRTTIIKKNSKLQKKHLSSFFLMILLLVEWTKLSWYSYIEC